MDEKVVNQEEKATPQVESTPPVKTEQPATESGAVEKKEPLEVADKSIPYSRFQEVNDRMKNAEGELAKYKKQELLKPVQETTPQDPYSGMSLEEKEQTRSFIEKFVKPEVRKEYEPFIQQVQTDRLNKQVNEAKQFASKFGIDFDQKLPEIVEYLQRPENAQRLTAKEAVVNLYFDQMTGSVKNQTVEELSKQKEELMEKKKIANLQSTSVSPGAVIQSDEAARAKMSRQEKLAADIQYGVEMAKKGEKHPKVKVD